MPCYITIQMLEAERQLHLERMRAKVSELQLKLKELKLLQEKYAQVSAMAHICIGSAYDTPLENRT